MKQHFLFVSLVAVALLSGEYVWAQASPSWDKDAMALRSRFRQGAFFVGGNVSFGDSEGDNDYVVANIDLFNVDKKTVNISFVGGYFLSPLTSVGLRGNVAYVKNEQTLEADFLNMAFNANRYMTQTLKTGYELHTYMRNYTPLGSAGQFYLFSETSLYYLNRNSYQRATRNPGMNDETISTIRDRTQGLGAGVSLGVTYFTSRNMAFELQLGTTGLEVQWKEITKDRFDTGQSRKISFRNGFNVLNIQMGVSYYFKLGSRN